ncbi:virion RNA polymerase [Pseudomonas phage YH30]|uniref:Virion assoviated RNA polymerase n=2 Tax=root TaxID=1 RepID=A0A0E3XC90_9CAUD|nr:virion RNA polymerase [Pseudomonas phage YH30]AKC04779.1 virion assoviated RNA polymerase [Pseudomonas phage YH30]
MADFDLDQFLSDRQEANAGATPAFDALDFASAGLDMKGSQKAYDLDGIRERKKRNVEESLIGKMGITPGAAGTEILNAAASFVSGTGRALGDVIALPINAAADMGQAGVTNEAIEAYNRYVSGQMQEGDEAILSQTAAGDDGVPQTMLQRMQGVDELRKLSTNVDKFFDWSSIVDTTRRDQLSDDIADATAGGVERLRNAGESFSRGEILDGLVQGALGVGQTAATAIGASATNPLAVGEYTVENAPQMLAYAANPVLGAATNVGYASDEYREGITEYQAENQGQLPDADDRLKMGLAAASLAVAEQVADAGILRGIRGEGGGLIRSTLGSSAREGVTEGYQTWGENVAHLKDTSLEEIVEAATIGAAVGGTMNIGGRAAVGARSGATRAEAALASREAVNAARETGDISALTDVTSESYNPAGAVVVLQEQVMADGVTQEVKDRALEQADTIEQEAAQRVSQLEQEQVLFSEEGLAKVEQAIEQREQAKQGADEATVARLDEELANLSGVREQIRNITPEQRQAQAKELKDAQQVLTATRDAIKRFQVEAAPKAAEVETLVQEAAVQPEASERLVTLTMINPDALSLEQVDALVADTSNTLTAEQRTSLRSFSEAQVALNELKGLSGVRTDIESGGDGFKGLPQYRNSVRMALMNGNEEAAAGQVDQLRAFADSRVAKFNAIDAAYQQVKGTDNSIRIVRDEAGNWTEAPESMTARQLKSAGGLEISARSFKLRDAVALEATALSRSAESLGELVKAGPIGRPNPVVQEAAPVQEAPVQVAEEVAPVEAPIAQVTEDVPVSEAESIQAEPSTEAETGELTAVREGEAVRGQEVAAENYQTTNLVSAFFQQSPARNDGDTQKPLVAVKDFATKIRTGEGRMAEFAGVKSFTGQQQSAIKQFMKFQRAAKPIIERTLKPYTSKTSDASRYYFRDYAQFLVNADGTLDENLTTAIAYGAYDWAIDAANNLVNTDAGINAILGKDSDDEVSPAAYAVLGNVGTRQATAASQLGAKIVDVLGLEVLPNAPVNERARLEASLGEHALALLVKMGVAKITTVSDAKLKSLMDSNEPANPRVKHYFLTPVSERVDGKLVPGAVARQIREANTGSQSILAKLFGSTEGQTEPSFTPVPFTQKNAKRTQQPVPKELAKILDDAGKRPMRLRQDMFQVWGNLSENALATIAGAVDVEGGFVHKANRAGTQAKNDGLVRQIDNFNEFFGRIQEVSDLGLEQPLYFDRSVWKPQRVGLTANMINPQTSKVHRHMLAMEGWENTINLSNKAEMDSFKLRVLESFGVKTEGNNTSKVLAKYDSKVNTPAIQAGVSALAEILRGEAQDTVANESAILAAVAEAGEKFFSLDGLVALAQEKIARDNGAESFTTQLLGEVDGVTNGPMLSLLMSGAKGFDTLNQGGFFSLEDPYTQFNDYKAQGNLDLYEGTIKAVLDRLGNEPLLSSVEVITGVLTNEEGGVSSKGRNVIKKPLTAMMFGSNTKTAVSGMTDAFIETIYSKMEDAANAGDQAALSKVIAAVNSLIGSKNSDKRQLWPTDMGFEQALNTVYSPVQQTAIKAAFYDLLGSKVESALNDTYEVFIARRDTINKTANMAFQMYEAVFQARRDELLASANLPRGNDGQPFADLTRAQIDQIRNELKDMEPILHTAFSKASGDLDSGMLMAKTRRELNDSPLYRSEVHFAEPLEFTDEEGRKQSVKSFRASGMTTVNEGPGVAPFITATHAGDSFISHNALMGEDVLNIHDAHGVGVLGMDAAGQRLNEQTFKLMLNYSAASEMVSTFERTLAGFSKWVQDPQVANQFGKYLESQKTTVSTQLASIRHVAEQADTDKLNMLANMRAVGQYATDGGSYIVTDADRAAAVKAREEIGSTFNPEAETMADAIDAQLKATPREAKPAARKPLRNDSVQSLAPATTLNTMDRIKADGQLQQDIQQVAQVMEKSNLSLESAKEVLPEDRAAEVVQAVQQNSRDKTSVWGELGQPVTPSDQALVDLLTETNDLTTRGLAEALVARTNDPFRKQVLRAALRSIREDVPVKLVTSTTGPEGAVGEGVSKARGWYATRGNFEALYVKSTEFVESGITEEMLTHELLHVSLGRTIQRELDKKQANANYDSATWRMVNDLEMIRARASDMLSKNGGLSSKYSNAVSNVHELVSWGMTNQGFQEEVLKKLEMPAGKRDAGFTDGLLRFIRNLTALLFRDTKPSDTNAMALVISNTSGLFAEAASQMAKRSDLTLKYEDAVDQVNAMSSEQIFNALESEKTPLTEAHSNKLKSVLNSIVTELYGPMGAFRNEVARGQALTTTDAVLKALDTGRLPFASQALASAFIVSPQEAYVLEQVEATVATTLNSNDGIFIRSSLENLWREAKDRLTAKDFFAGEWDQATQAEKDVAQEKYNFLFRPERVGSRSDYLSRFAALGVASQEVANLLQFTTRSSEKSLAGMPLATRLVEMFRRLLTRLGQLHDKTRPGEVAESRLFTLVDRLVDIEAKRRGRLADQKVGALDQVETALANTGEAIKDNLNRIAESTFFTQSDSPFVRVAGKTISTITNERVGLVLDGITRIRDNAFKSQHGMAMQVVNEMRGAHEGNLAAHTLFKQAKSNEMARKQHIEYTAAMINEGFKDNGQYLSTEDRAALTKGFLRTNMGNLREALGMDRLKEVLLDNGEFTNLRKDLEDQLLALPNGQYFLGAVKDLAYHRVIGGNVSPNLMLNSANIADMLGTKRVLQSSKADRAKAIELLDQLQAVYGWEYTGSQVKSRAREVLKTESNRTDGNGVDLILAMHHGLGKRSKDALFQGTERLYTDGYVPDIFDSKIEVLAVDRSDLPYFQKRGYAVAGDVQVDQRAGLESDKVLVTRRGSGQIGLLTGAMSYTGVHARGTKVDRQATNMLSSAPGTAKNAITTIKRNIAQDVSDMFLRDRSYDPRQQKPGRVSPVVNPNGAIVDYRYTMTEHNRDSLLDRDNSMEQVLGTLAGQIVDKVDSAIQNADVVRAMYDQFREDYANRPSSYLVVGKDSTDPQLLELYQLLPETTKREIRKTWGSDNMQIPADQLNMIMGYRKYSLTTPFGLAEDERNIAEKVLVRVAEAILGEKAALRIGRAEDVMQELVREAKDILVIKNITTLVGNIVSNMTLLAWEGVGLAEGVRAHATGIKAALQYRQDNKKLIQLQRALDVGYLPSGEQAVRDEIAVMMDRLNRNPIKPLVDAGLMPTIVEDVEADDSQYSYKSLLQKKTEKYTSKLPKLVRDIGRQVYMTHDTAVYKFLSQTTQLSDLVARYALYEHLTTRAKDPLSKADALRQAEESFINYDLPSGRGLQFMNDMGLVMFTKYYLRVQKVIARLIRQKPARALALVAANYFVSGLQSVMDSSWINRIGHNPFQSGPWSWPSSLSELPGIKGLMNL